MRTSIGTLLIVCTLVTAVILVLFVDSLALSSSKPLEIVVEPGDTLWSIAVRCAPMVDPRKSIDVIYDLNHLANARIQPGQLLLVPQGK